MGTAPKKARTASSAPKRARAARQLARRAAVSNVTASMEFAVFEDNGGAYYWRIQAGDGATLGQSEGFASYDDAEQAARHVREGAASAQFEPRAANAAPVDLTARRGALTDNSDAERWLDEGGSFSSEAVRNRPERR